MSAPRALVCGASGFIGGHLVRRLVSEGFSVRAVDYVEPHYASLPCDEFMLADLRRAEECARALEGPHFDHVYQVAADMGGMEYLDAAAAEIMHDNVLINAQMVDAAGRAGAGRYFFSSSVCVYRDMAPGEAELGEADAYPALPDNDYGWEKLYSERLVSALGTRYGMATRIARFQNCYGPLGCWSGLRAKAPAAICRKVAEATDGGTIDVIGDGSAVRSFVYVDDLVEGVRLLMESDMAEPTNVGTREYLTIAALVATVIDVAGKPLSVRAVDGPVGVRARNFSNSRIESLGYRPTVSLREGITRTYPWVAEQVRARDSIRGATPVGDQ
jgi:nucleoside-diphosphate-sugar epimerase